jgi:hypothetical protein
MGVELHSHTPPTPARVADPPSRSKCPSQAVPPVWHLRDATRERCSSPLILSYRMRLLCVAVARHSSCGLGRPRGAGIQEVVGMYSVMEVVTISCTFGQCFRSFAIRFYSRSVHTPAQCNQWLSQFKHSWDRDLSDDRLRVMGSLYGTRKDRGVSNSGPSSGVRAVTLYVWLAVGFSGPQSQRAILAGLTLAQFHQAHSGAAPPGSPLLRLKQRQLRTMHNNGNRRGQLLGNALGC